MAVELGLRPVGLAELQNLILADLDPRHGVITVQELCRHPHNLRIEGADRFRGACRHVELDIGNAERDAPEARRVRLIAAHAVAPGADRLDMVIMLGECERRSFQLLRNGCEPRQQRLAAGDDDAGMPAQHLRRAIRQMKLAPADIDPHVGVRDHQIGIAGQPEAGDKEQRRQPLIGDGDVDMLEMDRVAEILCGAVEWLLHDEILDSRRVGKAKRAHHSRIKMVGTLGFAHPTNRSLTSTNSPAADSTPCSQTPAYWLAGRHSRFPA